MIIESEKELKIAILTAIATTLICKGEFLLGAGCLALMLPWGILARVGGWLARPVIAWRLRNGKAQEGAA